jgi:hypothetical protein
VRRKSSRDEGRESLEGVVPDTLTPEGADPSAATSYTNIELRQSRWARTETNGWKSVAAVALIVGLCVGTMLLWILVDMGWDEFVALLGY